MHQKDREQALIKSRTRITAYSYFQLHLHGRNMAG